MLGMENSILYWYVEGLVLWAKYIGGDRYMRLKMHDIIEVSNSIVFLIMTCNPNWPEMKEALFPGKKPSERPDICNRVLKIKQRMQM